MLVLIPFLSAIYFAALYPLCHWTVRGVSLKNTFYRFNQGMCCVVLFFALAVSHLLPLSKEVLVLGWVFGLLQFAVSFSIWKSDKQFPMGAISGISLVGCIYAGLVTRGVLEYHGYLLVLQFTGGSIFSLAIFSTVLGHWYLEMRKLPMVYLMRTVLLFAFFLLCRLLLDGWLLMQGHMVNPDGDTVSNLAFLCSYSGLFGWVGVFFGTLFPLCMVYLVRKTLIIGSNTSATGILYVILISVFIGELAYKFSFMQYGLLL